MTALFPRRERKKGKICAIFFVGSLNPGVLREKNAVVFLPCVTRHQVRFFKLKTIQKVAQNVSCNGFSPHLEITPSWHGKGRKRGEEKGKRVVAAKFVRSTKQKERRERERESRKQALEREEKGEVKKKETFFLCRKVCWRYPLCAEGGRGEGGERNVMKMKRDSTGEHLSPHFRTQRK